MSTPILTGILAATVAVSLAACGGGGGGNTADAAHAADAVPQHVHMTTCTGTPPTITTVGFAFSPQLVNIAPGGLVHFMINSSAHNVVSTTVGQMFSLPFNADACLKFDVAGTYTFKCQPHGFTGSVVVQ